MSETTDPAAGERWCSCGDPTAYSLNSAEAVTHGVIECRVGPVLTAGVNDQRAFIPDGADDAPNESKGDAVLPAAPHPAPAVDRPTDPAEPDAGDVEALAEVLADSFAEWLHRMHGVVSSCDHAAEGLGIAEAVLTSDWLDSVHRKAGDERAEQIAQAIRDEYDGYLASRNLDPAWIAGWHAATRHHAARIARESR